MILERIRDLNRNYLLYLIVLTAGIYSLDWMVAYAIITYLQYLFLWTSLGTTFLFIYTLRFRKKVDLKAIEYIKLIIALLLPFVQMIGYLGYANETETLMHAPIIYLWIAFFVYVFDRIIQKLWLMNRKYITVLIIQAVLSVLIIAYAFVQQTLAKEAERKALAAEKEAVSQRDAAATARAEADIRNAEFQKRIDALTNELNALKARKNSGN
jgi:hypothetical protein